MSGWSYEWFPTPGQAVFDHSAQRVAAVSRAPGKLDLFIVGLDNHVWTTYEFPIRVPSAELRGAKADDVRINVVEVHEQPQEPLRAMSLVDDPNVRTSTVATTTLAQVRLPDALAQVMAS